MTSIVEDIAYALQIEEVKVLADIIKSGGYEFSVPFMEDGGDFSSVRNHSFSFIYSPKILAGTSKMVDRLSLANFYWWDSKYRQDNAPNKRDDAFGKKPFPSNGRVRLVGVEDLLGEDGLYMDEVVMFKKFLDESAILYIDNLSVELPMEIERIEGKLRQDSAALEKLRILAKLLA